MHQKIESKAVLIYIRIQYMIKVVFKIGGNRGRDFPGGPVAKTLSSQCRGPGFNPWSVN